MRPDAWRRVRSWEGMLFAILLVVVVYSAIETPGYLTVQNQVNLMQLGIEKAIITLAMAFVIICGEIDLSIGSMVGLCGVIFGLLADGGLDVALAIVLTMIVGILLGALNGVLSVLLQVPTIIITLGMLSAYRGAAYFLSNGYPISGFAKDSWF